MRFSTSDPPEFKSKYWDFSGASINPYRCFYYLSLLERFVEATHDMPESVLKLYLVRAEYRYYRWISSNLYRNSTPPLDVAFFLQTHMLRPIQFEQDIARRMLRDPPVQYDSFQSPTSLEGIVVPLKEIHEYRESAPFTLLRKWKEIMGEKEPYYLTKEKLIESSSTSCAEISCIICFIKMDVNWDDFVEWRLDHTVALACHRCSGMFTIKHVGKANLLHDIGNRDYRSNQARKFPLPSYALQKMKQLPFNLGLTRIESFMPSDMCTKDQQKEFVDFVQSTYLCHPYKGSFDLIYAVARQYKFAYKITKLAPWKLPDDITNAIDEYQEFLSLIEANRDLVAVPTMKADLIWHLHMLNPSVYHKETILALGHVLNHNDDIPENELKQHAKDTQKRWKILRQEEAKKTFLSMLNSKKREEEAKLREKSKDIKDLIKFNNSDTIMQEKFGHLMCTREGFPGQVLLYLFDHSLRIVIIFFIIIIIELVLVEVSQAKHYTLYTDLLAKILICNIDTEHLDRWERTEKISMSTVTWTIF
ncbi:hypothetical protein PS15m_011006 [Mucor circinelloides]